MATGFPEAFIASVAEYIFRTCKAGWKRGQVPTTVSATTEREKIVVVSYKHRLSHSLKEIGKCAAICLILSPPYKLISPPKSTSPLKQQSCAACSVKHRTRYLQRVCEVVYMIPLSCGAGCVGQMGRCLNDRIREHANNVKNGKDGFLGYHCTSCKCTPLFENTVTLYKHRNDRTRIIVESAKMASERDSCISKPSVALSEKKLSFLGSIGARTE
uniref:Tick transposon n=1 Tax=Rhipicephalus zambeziensis TaxID=60191 RepID=A0A224Z391_9ACAR